ncbi:MAG: CoA transferase [Candidatus Tectomicrobia bacterium]|uniref:CoA transferase n=1 Tax=Tectimicrobiota bacterium TaxID=2528274 RepID=A0A937W0I8_UNCTE|nr:CoA transferase [Candidatus Tectomicrobia bacterium]
MAGQAASPITEGMLSPYRVLDLTDERGLLCGKILADLGADVIQIEPPAGNTARRLGPFYHDEVHPERSLFWWSYAANKRSLTLDIHTADGQALLKRLLPSADFLIESDMPGTMHSLGLGYAALAAINPRLIMVSISPFGQDGPYATYEAPDLVGMGLGGFMYVTGDPDRPPVRISVPHFYLHGAGVGATGAMIAHAQRVLTGQGQHVDASCQEAVCRVLANVPQSYVMAGSVIARQGSYRQTGAGMFMRITWPCKDGFVNFQFSGGTASGASVNNFARWMEEEGMGDAYLSSLDFTKLGYGTITRELLARVVPPVERFLMQHTKQELFEEAVARRILLFPVATPHDIVHNPQLQARQYFQEVPHPDLGTSLTMLGPFVRASATPLTMRHFAPKLGEHNTEIYINELGMQPAELARLRAAGVV